MTDDNQWLQWAQKLHALATTGLHFSENGFDTERYDAVQQVAAEMMAALAEREPEAIREIFDAQAGYITPKVDVRGMVFHNDRLLMVREKLDNGRWTVPGGWADVGDAPGEAVIREVSEEAGYSVRAVKLIAVHDRTKHNYPPYMFHLYKMFFLCELISEEQNFVANTETDETAWFAEDDIPADLSTGRVTLAQITRCFEHLRNPDLPTEFD